MTTSQSVLDPDSGITYEGLFEFELDGSYVGLRSGQVECLRLPNGAFFLPAGTQQGIQAGEWVIDNLGGDLREMIRDEIERLRDPHHEAERRRELAEGR